jgi:peptidoglycan hydrolase CwlO-like protein
MQEYLLYLQEVWSAWYPLTLQHPDYAATLAIATWLLTAMFYSLRVGFLKSKIKRGLNALAQSEQAKAAAEQQIGELQAQAQEHAVQLQQAQEVADAQTQISEQLQHRLDSLAQMLREQLQRLNTWAPAENGDDSCEGVWQRMQQAVAQLHSDLQTKQQEHAALQTDHEQMQGQLGAKDQELQTLQGRLDSQSLQLSKLEVSLAELQDQNSNQSALQQRIAELEQQLTQSKQAAAAQPAAAKPAVVATAPSAIKAEAFDSSPMVVDVPKQPAAAAPFAVSAPSPAPVAAPAEAAKAPAAPTPPSAPAVPAKSNAKSGGMFANMMRKLGSLDEKFGALSNPPAKHEFLADEAGATEPQPSQEPAPQPPLVETAPLNESKSGLGKLGGLFKKRG